MHGELAGIEQVGYLGQPCNSNSHEKEHTPDAVSHGRVLIRPGDRRHEHRSNLEGRERAVECLATDHMDDYATSFVLASKRAVYTSMTWSARRLRTYATSRVNAVAITSAPARFERRSAKHCRADANTGQSIRRSPYRATHPVRFKPRP